MSTPPGAPFSPLILSPAGREVLANARRLAEANSRREPSADDLMVCLLLFGTSEVPFDTILRQADIFPNGLVKEILDLARESGGRVMTKDVGALEDFGERFWAGLARMRERMDTDIDCSRFLAALMASAFMPAATRELIIARGIVRDALLAAPAIGAVPAGEGSAKSKDESGRKRAGVLPPIGQLLTPEGAPMIVGRNREIGEITARIARGLPTLLIGPDGVGKSVLARHAAARSDRPMVYVDAVSLAVFTVPERRDALTKLAAYLKKTKAGLVVGDLDLAAIAMNKPFLIDVPFVATVSSDDSVTLPIVPKGRYRRMRISDLGAEAAVRTIEAWNQQPGHPAVDLNDVEHAVSLAVDFLGANEALPGSAITLIKAAASDDRPAVDRASLEDAVGYLTGLPRAIVSPAERERLRSIGSRLSSRLIGQQGAIEQVSRAIIRHELSVSTRRRPIGSFLFVGPTGVGKTELARVLASERYGSTDALVRFDMSEFYDDHEIARLIGSPPGYMGSNLDGQLIAAIKARPNGGVLLLDEIEKADPKLLDFFLGALDYATVTASNTGQKISLLDWIIIFTSNIGAGDGDDARRKNTLGFRGAAELDVATRQANARAEAVKRHFRSRPEFVNRLDAVVEFSDLSREEMLAVLRLHVSNYAADHAMIGMNIELGPVLAGQMVDEAMASGFGARDLVTRRFQVEVEDRITEALLAGHYRRGAHYLIEVGPDGQGSLSRTPSIPAH